jgi:branched-chain amino acid aminotransferase
MPDIVEPKWLEVPSEVTSSGCFETMRAYRGRIFRLAAHLDRLEASAVFVGVPLPWTKRQLATRLRRALARSALKEAVVRIAVLPSPPTRGHARHAVRGGGVKTHVVVQAIQRPPEAVYRRGITVACVPSRKFAVGSITPQAKYSARLGSILAVSDAQLRGADEAIFLDPMGVVTESTASNLGMVRDEAIVTPPCWLGLLPGITRDVLAELAVTLGMALTEMPLTRHEVYNAREVFLLSTIKEVLAVTTVDGRRIGDGRPGPITKRLRQAFRDLVRRELGH